MTFHYSVSVIALATIGLTANRNVKILPQRIVVQESEMCQKKIKFTINTIKKGDSLVTLSIPFDIVLDPPNKEITVVTTNKKNEKINVVTNIVDSKCNTDNQFTKGEMQFNGYVLQPNKAKDYSIITFKAQNGNVIIQISDPVTKRDVNYSMIVSKWQLF